MKQEEFTQVTSDQMSGFHVFYHLNTLKNFSDSIFSSSANLERSKVDLKKETAVISSIIQFCSILSQCMLLGVTAFLYSKGEVEIGFILSIGNLGGTFFNSVNAFSSNYTIFKSMNEFKKKFDFISDDLIEIDVENEGEDIEELYLEKVSFSYDKKQILKDFNSTFYKKKKYLLFGESGRGKSTILKLLIGDICPSSGRIIVNKDKIAANNFLRKK